MPAVLRLHAERTRNRTDLDISTSCDGAWTVREQESASVCFWDKQHRQGGLKRPVERIALLPYNELPWSDPKGALIAALQGVRSPPCTLRPGTAGGCEPAASGSRVDGGLQDEDR